MTQDLLVQSESERKIEALKLDKWQCVQCGSRRPLDIHHILPLAQGGSNRLTNMVSLCRECHQQVHGRKF